MNFTIESGVVPPPRDKWGILMDSVKALADEQFIRIPLEELDRPKKNFLHLLYATAKRHGVAIVTRANSESVRIWKKAQ